MIQILFHIIKITHKMMINQFNLNKSIDQALMQLIVLIKRTNLLMVNKNLIKNNKMILLHK